MWLSSNSSTFYSCSFVTRKLRTVVSMNAKYLQHRPGDIQFIYQSLVSSKRCENGNNIWREFLFIIEPLTTIVGGPEIFINTGSTINLTCIVKNSPESPFAMYWQHGSEVSVMKNGPCCYWMTEIGDFSFCSKKFLHKENLFHLHHHHHHLLVEFNFISISKINFSLCRRASKVLFSPIALCLLWFNVETFEIF